MCRGERCVGVRGVAWRWCVGCLCAVDTGIIACPDNVCCSLIVIFN